MWLDPSRPKNVSAISRELGLARRSVHRWLQDPGFTAWFNEQVDRHTAHGWEPMLHKLATLALSGSVEHMRLLAQIRGALHPASLPSSSISIVMGVPRQSTTE